jgi:3-hexulose-6-phosphate synthase
VKLQLALDTPDLVHELDLVGKVGTYVDQIEAGTPLLIREGIRAVREVRRRYRGRPVVADIKVIDAGEPIAELAFAAGASVVTVLGCASDEVIARVVRSAQRYDGGVMADSLSVTDIPKRAAELAKLGVASLCVNRRGLGQQDAGSREAKVERLAALIRQIELPVYLAGGINHEELLLLRDLPLAGVIIGAAIAEAPSPIESAKRMRDILERRVNA